MQISTLRNLPIIGNGIHSDILEWGTQKVLKVTAVSYDFAGAIDSDENHMLNAEYNMLTTLSSFKFVVNVYKKEVIEGVLSSTTGRAVDATQSMVIWMKRAYYGSLFSFMRKKPVHITHDANVLFKNVLFQAAFALHKIYEVYPGFLHNDYKLDNILIVKATDTGSTRYVCEKIGKRFFIPNFGYEIRLCDFNISCIPGVVDNYNTLETRFQFHSYGIEYTQNHKSDIFKFTSCLYACVGHRLDPVLRNTVNKLFNGHLENPVYDENLFYATPDIYETLPSVYDILNCEDIFKSHPSGKKTNVTPVIPVIKKIDVFKNITPKNRKQSITTGDVIKIITKDLLGTLKPKTIRINVNVFLNKFTVSLKHYIVVVIFAFVDEKRKNGVFEIGKDSWAPYEWIEHKNIDISETDFCKIGFQWYVNKK